MQTFREQKSQGSPQLRICYKSKISLGHFEWSRSGTKASFLENWDVFRIMEKQTSYYSGDSS